MKTRAKHNETSQKCASAGVGCRLGVENLNLIREGGIDEMIQGGKHPRKPKIPSVEDYP